MIKLVYLCDCPLPKNYKKKGYKHIWGYFREVEVDDFKRCKFCNILAVVSNDEKHKSQAAE